MIQVEVIEDLGRLHAIEAEWWTLWRDSPVATPFQSPAWLIPWAQTFRPDELRVAVVRTNGRLSLLAPLMLLNEAGRRLTPLGLGVTDYLDLVAEPDAGAASFRELAAVVREMSWTRLDMEDLAPNASALALAPLFADEAETPSLVHQACPRIGWRPGEDPLAQAPSRRRRQLRRARAFAEARGRLRFERASSPELFLAELLRLHALRWESRSERGVLADERVARFHAAALPRFEAAGLSRCYLLWIDERCVGAFYGFSDTRAVYAYLGGFDPEFSYESPGALLIEHALAEAAREGALAFDFLRGQEPYKYSWGARDRWTLRWATTRRERRHDVGFRAAG